MRRMRSRHNQREREAKSLISRTTRPGQYSPVRLEPDERRRLLFRALRMPGCSARRPRPPNIHGLAGAPRNTPPLLAGTNCLP